MHRFNLRKRARGAEQSDSPSPPPSEFVPRPWAASLEPRPPTPPRRRAANEVPDTPSPFRPVPAGAARLSTLSSESSQQPAVPQPPPRIPRRLPDAGTPELGSPLPDSPVVVPPRSQPREEVPLQGPVRATTRARATRRSPTAGPSGAAGASKISKKSKKSKKAKKKHATIRRTRKLGLRRAAASGYPPQYVLSGVQRHRRPPAISTAAAQKQRETGSLHEITAPLHAMGERWIEFAEQAKQVGDRAVYSAKLGRMKQFVNEQGEYMGHLVQEMPSHEQQLWLEQACARPDWRTLEQQMREKSDESWISQAQWEAKWHQQRAPAPDEVRRAPIPIYEDANNLSDRNTPPSANEVQTNFGGSSDERDASGEPDKPGEPDEPGEPGDPIPDRISQLGKIGFGDDDQFVDACNAYARRINEEAKAVRATEGDAAADAYWKGDVNSSYWHEMDDVVQVFVEEGRGKLPPDQFEKLTAELDLSVPREKRQLRMAELLVELRQKRYRDALDSTTRQWIQREEEMMAAAGGHEDEVAQYKPEMYLGLTEWEAAGRKKRAR